jgi:hypothetical protein
MVAGTKTKISIKFVGKMSEGSGQFAHNLMYQKNVLTFVAGLYKASYTGEDGTQKWMACTQMEPTDARRVCITLHMKPKKLIAYRYSLAWTNPPSRQPSRRS